MNEEEIFRDTFKSNFVVQSPSCIRLFTSLRHHLLQFAQVHVHGISDSMQPSPSLSSQQTEGAAEDDSMAMSLSKLWETVKDREAGWALQSLWEVPSGSSGVLWGRELLSPPPVDPHDHLRPRWGCANFQMQPDALWARMWILRKALWCVPFRSVTCSRRHSDLCLAGGEPRPAPSDPRPGGEPC